MKYILESLSQVYGNAPTRPDKEKQSDELKKIYKDKIGNLSKAELEAAHLEHHSHFFRKWQRRR